MKIRTEHQNYYWVGTFGGWNFCGSRNIRVGSRNSGRISEVGFRKSDLRNFGSDLLEVEIGISESRKSVRKRSKDRHGHSRIGLSRIRILFYNKKKFPFGKIDYYCLFFEKKTFVQKSKQSLI